MASRRCDGPDWLAALVDAVMADIDGDRPLAGIRITSVVGDEPGAFMIGVSEQDGTGRGGGWPCVTAETPRARALLILAEDLQEACAETRVGWGQSRPPCPYHPHPLRPADRGGAAWWICEARDEPVHRIATGDVRAAGRARPRPGRHRADPGG